jgi:hypothetical protein
MYIDLSTNAYDLNLGAVTNSDANTQTGLFNEFGFSQLMATSVYDLSDGSVLGSFYDTNKANELTNLGVPTSGLAMDGTTTVTLSMPTGSQLDIDALSPLSPPIASDDEGFLLTWDLRIAYHLIGTLGASGPSYTGGTFDIWFNDIANDANDRVVLSGNLTGSNLQAANLLLYFDITDAESGFLFIETAPGSGVFKDATTLEGVSNPREFVLDTNVNPPIPTADQLLVVADCNNATTACTPAAVRQTTLDGSITPMPEPGTIALLGAGLLGLGALRRRKSA